MVKYAALDDVFRALGDATRRRILRRVARRPLTVSEIAAPFAMSLPAVSKHLKVLERAGLVSRGREAQWRPRRLEAEPLKEAQDWLAHYQRFWNEGLDRLTACLEEET